MAGYGDESADLGRGCGGCRQLAQRYGPVIANAIEGWWAGSATQTNIGVLQVRQNERFGINIIRPDDQVTVQLPGFIQTVQLDQQWTGSWSFGMTGESAFVIHHINAMGADGNWRCQVEFIREGSNQPIVWVNTSGNDGMFKRVERLFLGGVIVTP